jgi:hypothetical protein
MVQLDKDLAEFKEKAEKYQKEKVGFFQYWYLI